MKEGIVLFAHGSRDPAWARPFAKIRRQVQRKRPGAIVVLAYLERMQPTLAAALYQLAARDIRSIRIVPLFLGAGDHIKKDLRNLTKGLGVRVDPPIGEQPQVIRAIAAAIAKRAR